jgi:putative aldouronate transport system substrate-binding protein
MATLERRPIGRRDFLRGAAGLSAVLLGGSALASCGGNGTGTGSSAPSAAAALPDYVPVDIVPPDLAATAEGVQAGYFRYPTQLVTTVDTPPGSGQPLDAMIVTYNVPPTNSQYVDAVNTALGSDINLIYVPEPEYQTRFATVVAGGDLPELMQIPLFANLPQLADFFKARCVDLTDHVSGEAVRDYPHLAALPTASWRNPRIDGRIWGIPLPRNMFNRAAFYRQDIVEASGESLPTDAESFLEFCRAFTDPAAGKYAIAGFDSGAISPLVLVLFSGMFNVPNQWRVEDDQSLTYYIETDEFRESVDYTRRLWEAGVFHPDSPTLQSNRAADMFNSGQVLISENGNTGWRTRHVQGAAVSPQIQVGAFGPIGADGGEGTHWLKEGAFGYTVISKDAEDRVEELLGILNYLAAPFGSVEYDLLKWGVEGTHFTRDAEGPVPNDLGKEEVWVSYTYLASALDVLYSPGLQSEVTEPAHAWQTQMSKVGIPDPTIGLYSESASRTMASLKTLVNDELTAVVVGRKDISALDELAQTWRSRGGDRIRTEYEEALAAEG